MKHAIQSAVKRLSEASKDYAKNLDTIGDNRVPETKRLHEDIITSNGICHSASREELACTGEYQAKGYNK